MAVTLYNTLTRSKERIEWQPDEPVGYYCCGPTVYGPAHIGNFRTFVVQDVLRRVLEVDGAQVTHVRNITDVDDKTIRGSLAEGTSLSTFTEKWTERFHADCDALNLLKPVHEPRATAHIPQQIAMIEQLLHKGHAYQSSDGSVYFRVSSYADYGKLANLDMEALQTQSTNSAGEVNDADEYDRDSVRDFALWKARKPEDGDNYWASPWGDGRPGWHIECSAMSTHYLGNCFAIHGGGIDLCFPHHTNEIAQSECATGCAPFVKHWFHCAHLMVEGEKMSKSLGNLHTLDALQQKGYQVSEIRYTLLGGHYRQQLNFTLNGLKAARSALGKIEKSIRLLMERIGEPPEAFDAFCQPSALVQTGLFQTAWEALCDDLNVPAALGESFSALKQLERDPDYSKVALRGQLEAFGAIAYALGLQGLTTASTESAADIPPEIADLAQKRWDAKQARDFALADTLRQQLTEAGWQVLDRKDGYALETV